MLVLLRQRLVAVRGQSYFYAYWDVLDHMSHTYEPHSEQYLAELNSFSHLLQTELLEKIDKETAREIIRKIDRKKLKEHLKKWII